MIDDDYIFVSFSHRDVSEIRPIIAAIRSKGLAVWWSDDCIPEGRRFDEQIERALETARLVVAFISPEADAAVSDFIYEEVERARRLEKLVPVIIGEGGRSFAMRGMVSRIQSHTFQSFSELLEHPRFDLFFSSLMGKQHFVRESSKDVDVEPVCSTSEERVEAWFDWIERQFTVSGQIKAFSMALACAMFEQGPYTEVQKIGEDLASRIAENEIACDENTSLSFPNRTGLLLKALEAEIQISRRSSHGLQYEIIRFQDRERASALIRFAWREFARRRPVIEAWLREVAMRTDSEGRMRIGLAIGLLGQIDFLEIFNEVACPWLANDVRPLFDVVDIALAVAAYEPAAANALSERIKSWAASTSIEERTVAIRLACGITGSRLAGSAVEILRVATRDHNSHASSGLHSAVERGLRLQLDTHSSDSDTSLFNLRGLISDLSRWVFESLDGGGVRRAPNAMPLLIFLSVIGGVALASRSAAPSRATLEALTLDRSTTARIAAVFSISLAHHRIGGLRSRDFAKRTLKRWISVCCDDERKVQDEDLRRRRRSALLNLAAALYQTNHGSDERDRIAFVFGVLFDQVELATPMHEMQSHRLEETSSNDH